MSNLIIRPEWYIPERRVTPESAYQSRRAFLKSMGLGAGLVATGMQASAAEPDPTKLTPVASGGKYPAPRNKDYSPTWRLTDEEVATSYNNFYEFSLDKERVKMLTGKFVTSPWSIAIGGLVEKPLTLTMEDILKDYTLEERVYRFRCVEAWSMIVPWTGFQLSKLIEKVKPKAEAKYVRFETFNRPDQAPGFSRLPQYPWPYYEGLRMDEAMHPLTLVTTGIYGKPMPKQNGAPVRIVVSWKYGYKSIKSIVKIDFVEKVPSSFWEELGPTEYPFESNVDPGIPHPRWSQATERIVDTGDRVRTQIYNGYGAQVAKLYAK